MDFFLLRLTLVLCNVGRADVVTVVVAAALPSILKGTVVITVEREKVVYHQTIINILHIYSQCVKKKDSASQWVHVFENEAICVHAIVCLYYTVTSSRLRGLPSLA